MARPAIRLCVTACILMLVANAAALGSKTIGVLVDGNDPKQATKTKSARYERWQGFSPLPALVMVTLGVCGAILYRDWRRSRIAHAAAISIAAETRPDSAAGTANDGKRAAAIHSQPIAEPARQSG